MDFSSVAHDCDWEKNTSIAGLVTQRRRDAFGSWVVRALRTPNGERGTAQPASLGKRNDEVHGGGRLR